MAANAPQRVRAVAGDIAVSTGAGETGRQITPRKLGGAGLPRSGVRFPARLVSGAPARADIARATRLATGRRFVAMPKVTTDYGPSLSLPEHNNVIGDLVSLPPDRGWLFIGSSSTCPSGVPPGNALSRVFPCTGLAVGGELLPRVQGQAFDFIDRVFASFQSLGERQQFSLPLRVVGEVRPASKLGDDLFSVARHDHPFRKWVSRNFRRIASHSRSRAVRPVHRLAREPE